MSTNGSSQSHPETSGWHFWVVDEELRGLTAKIKTQLVAGGREEGVGWRVRGDHILGNSTGDPLLAKGMHKAGLEGSHTQESQPLLLPL